MANFPKWERNGLGEYEKVPEQIPIPVVCYLRLDKGAAKTDFVVDSPNPMAPIELKMLDTNTEILVKSRT